MYFVIKKNSRHDYLIGIKKKINKNKIIFIRIGFIDKICFFEDKNLQSILLDITLFFLLPAISLKPFFMWKKEAS